MEEHDQGGLFSLPYNKVHDAKNGGIPLCNAVSAIFFLPELSKKRQMSETVIRIRKIRRDSVLLAIRNKGGE